MERRRVQFGPTSLAALRDSRGLSLRQVAGITKIPPMYLEAIESGEWDKLPGGLYTRSYLRQYARAVDCDEDDLLEAASGTRPGAREDAGEQRETPSPQSMWQRLLRFIAPGSKLRGYMP